MSEHLKLALEALRRAESRMTSIAGVGVPGTIPSEAKKFVAQLLNEGIADVRVAIQTAETYARLSKESASALEGQAVTDATVSTAIAAAKAARNALPFFGAINTADEIAQVTMRAALESALAMQPPHNTHST